MIRVGPTLLLLLLPAAGANLPDYPVKPVAQYNTVADASGIAVAALALDDEREQRKYFGVRLRPRGYIPVLLVIENRNSAGSYIFRKESITGGPSDSMPARAGRNRTGETTLSVASAAPALLGIGAAALLSKVSDIRHNLVVKEIRNVTIAPSSSVHGFVYIPANWRRKPNDRVALSILFTQSGADTSVVVSPVF